MSGFVAPVAKQVRLELLGDGFRRLGRLVGVLPAREMGRMLLFVLSSFAWLARPPFRFHQIMKQLHFIGYRSTFVVVLTAGFTGMVLALQGYYSLRKFGSEGLLGSAVALSMIRELGPVLAALMVTARAGSAMSSRSPGCSTGARPRAVATS